LQNLNAQNVRQLTVVFTRGNVLESQGTASQQE
jgi:hypothetical protein